MAAGKNTAQENGSEQDARKRRILKLFPMLDATPGERASALPKMLRMIEENGTKFSDYFVFKEQAGSSSGQNGLDGESIEALEGVVEALVADVEGMKKDLRQKIIEIDNLSREGGRLKKIKEKVEDEVYDYKCEVFRINGLPKPTHPRDGISSQEPPKKPKKRSKPTEFPSDPFAKPARGPDLGDKNPTWKRLVNKIDQGGPSAKTAVEDLQKLFEKEGLRFIDVIEPKEGNGTLDPKEKEEIAKLQDSIDSLFRESVHLCDEIEDKNETILQTKIKNSILQKKAEALKNQLLFYKKELKEKQSQQTTATPGTQFTQPQPTPQPTPQPPPVQPTPQPQPQPQPGTTRIVTPPPRQPATPTPGPTTTQTPPHKPQPTPKKKSIWTWPFRHPVITLAASCVLYFGGSYAIPAVGDLFSRAAQEVSTPATPSPYQTPAPSPNGGNGYAPQAQRTHYQTFYVAYDPISFWKKVTNGNGSQRIDMLHFGDQVQVELPAGQDRIYESDKWVHIKDANNREGYVMGKQLSATVPVRAPIEPEPTPNWSAPVPQKTTDQTRRAENDATEPYARKAMKAYVCAGKELTTIINGSYVHIDSSTPIEACVSYYSIHGGQDTRLQLCSYKNEANEPNARVFLSYDPRVAIHVPYDAISLERSSCTQTQIIKGNYAEPK